MSSTTVHSNTSIAGSAFVATEKTVEIPPKGQVYEAITNYVEAKDNLEIPAGDAIIYKDGTMKKQDGSVAKLSQRDAFEQCKDAGKTRKQDKAIEEK